METNGLGKVFGKKSIFISKIHLVDSKFCNSLFNQKTFKVCWKSGCFFSFLKQPCSKMKITFARFRRKLFCLSELGTYKSFYLPIILTCWKQHQHQKNAWQKSCPDLCTPRKKGPKLYEYLKETSSRYTVWPR